MSIFTGLSFEDFRVNGEENLKRGNAAAGESGSGGDGSGVEVAPREGQTNELVMMTGPLGEIYTKALNIAFKKKDINEYLDKDPKDKDPKYLKLSKETNQFFDEQDTRAVLALQNQELGANHSLKQEHESGDDTPFEVGDEINENEQVEVEFIDETQTIDRDPSLVVFPIQKKDFDNPIVMAPLYEQAQRRDDVGALQHLLWVVDSDDKDAIEDPEVLVEHLNQPLKTITDRFKSSTESFFDTRNTKVARGKKNLLKAVFSMIGKK